MPRKGQVNSQTDVNTGVTSPNTTMTDQIKTSATTDLRPIVAFESNEQKTSHKIVVYNHEDWNPLVDLSLNDWNQANAGLSAVAKFVAGGLAGSPKLIITAPTEKLAFANGTGTFAYVRNDFVPGVDDVAVEIGGQTVLLTVDPQDIPTGRGYYRLKLDGGYLYKESWTKLVEPRMEDPWLYWYCRAFSAILEGFNVSVSVGPKLMHDAQQVMVVVNSDNPAEANETRRYAGRVGSRFNSTVRATEAQLETQEVQVSAGAGDLEVSLQGGGTISLKAFSPVQPINLVTSTGITLAPKFLSEDSDKARVAMAAAINEIGALVVLS